MESNLSLTTHNIDLTFKKGNYTNTYMHIRPMGTPSGFTAYLLDENDNQLYSPVDANGSPGKTPCSVTIGSTNVMPLPANYDGNTYTDFDVGTYNWKLKYNGNAIYKSYTIPIIVKIVDFKVWDPIHSIYPNEHLYANVKNYDNTIPIVAEANNLYGHISDIHGSENVIYEDVAGTLGFYDIDTSIGQHTYHPDNLPSHNIEYEVKNPIEFWTSTPSITYGTQTKIGYKILIGSTKTERTIKKNGTIITPNNTGRINNEIELSYINNLIPGTYNWEIIGSTTACQGNFSCFGTTEVKTDNCTITLETNNRFSPNSTLTGTYKYNNTPIPDAKIEIYKDDTLIDTLMTDSNGQISLSAQGLGNYIAKVIDIGTDNILLISNTIEILIGIEGSHYTYDLEDLTQQDIIAKVTSNLGEVISVNSVVIRAPDNTHVLVSDYNFYNITQQDITVYYDPSLITFTQGNFPIHINFNYSNYGESKQGYGTCLLTIE